MADAAAPLASADLVGGIYRGIHRIVGTFLGIGIMAALLLPVPWHLNTQNDAFTLVILIISFLFTTELFLVRRYGFGDGVFTPVILLPHS